MSQHPLYHKLILQHSKHPQNFGSLRTPTVEAEESNPVCGDRVSLQVIIFKNIISDIKFQGEGCAISQASASLMTTLLKGLGVPEAKLIAARFRTTISEENDGRDNLPEELQVLEHVRQYPVRKKCVLLAWDALGSALTDYIDKLNNRLNSAGKFP